MKLHTYTLLRACVDARDGWWKYFLRRDDGKEVAVPKKRYLQLSREGRLT